MYWEEFGKKLKGRKKTKGGSGTGGSPPPPRGKRAKGVAEKDTGEKD